MFCEIRVRGHLSTGWSAWFDGLDVANCPNGEVLLSGALPDQAALFGVLNRLHGLNLRLLSLTCADNSPTGSTFGE
jgi:hypothetical protein